MTASLKTSLTLPLTVLAVCLFTAAQSSAALLFEETFESYSDGDLLAQSAWASTGTDKSYTVQSSTFSYAAANLGSNSLRVTETGPSNTLLNQTGAFGPVSGQDLYVAFYGYVPQTKTNSFFYTGANSQTRLGINGSGGDISARLDGTNGSSTANQISTGSFVVLGRYNWNSVANAYTSADVWFKSDGTLIDINVDPIFASVTDTAPFLTSIDDIFMGMARMSFNDTGSEYFDVDNIRVGTTAQFALTAIPEPTSGMLLLAAAGLVLRRRAE